MPIEETLVLEPELTEPEPIIEVETKPEPAIVETQAVEMVEAEPPPPEPVKLEVTTTLERGAVQPPMLPKSGMIRIDNEPWRRVSIPHVQTFDPNQDYTVALDIPGYNVTPLEPITIKENSTAPISFVIAPRMVEFKIISNVADAKLRRGGKTVGRVNEYVIVKPYEDFELQVEAEGYIKQTIYIDALDPNRPSVSRHVTLQPYPSEIEISADFPDLFAKEEKLEVFLNGKSHGFHKLPYRAMNLTPQVYSIEIKGDGFNSVEPAQVDLGPGTRKSARFELAFRPAELQLDVSPTNAVVMIKGKEHMERNLKLDPGMYKIQISAPGYKTQNVSARLRAGELKKYKTELEPLTYIELTLTPSTTSIYMKNRKVRGPQIHLTPGVEYELEFRAVGHKTISKTYRLNRGQTLKDTITLKKKFF